MPTVKITKRQKEMLQMVYKYIENSGYPPTMEEMREALNVTSNQSVIDLLKHLEVKQIIKRQEGVARSIAILPSGYDLLGKPVLAPFLGISHAGSPIDMIEINGNWEEIPGGLQKLSSQIFILKVSGDSMINAGIDDGDMVLVQEQKEFKSEDIVLANMDGEATIKRFISDDKPPYVYLKPENPNHKVILFTHKMRLVGKIISVLKTGNWKSVN